MSQKKIEIERFFTIPVHELYGYFMDPRLLEKWCYPEGMTLHMDFLDARVGGKYRMVHTLPGKKYIANGHYRKLLQNELIQMVDDEIIGPDGKVMETNLACEIYFTSFGSGSGIRIIQYGFKDERGASECERGWSQCLNNLQDLVKDSGPRQFHAEERNQNERNA